MQKTFLLVTITVLLTSCKKPVEKETEAHLVELDIPQMIAYAHGLKEWDRVKELKFTFNVDREENHFERSWAWNPKTGDVALYTQKDTLQYNQNKLDSLSRETDARFINDKHWLLAPFKLAWDEGTTFTHIDSAVAPISKKVMQQLTVTYSDEGGYTPGDAYDFYFESDFIIKEWIFRKSNEPTPGLTATWEGYEDHHGLKIATMHNTSDDAFKLYFTNIEVQTTNE